MLKKAALIALITALFLMLSACSAAENQIPAEPAAGESAQAEAVTPEEPAAENIEDGSQEETTVAALPTEQVDYCLECHTDKETLTALAKPEEKAEAESEGVG